MYQMFVSDLRTSVDEMVIIINFIYKCIMTV